MATGETAATATAGGAAAVVAVPLAAWEGASNRPDGRLFATLVAWNNRGEKLDVKLYCTFDFLVGKLKETATLRKGRRRRAAE